jgi:hypothetical protein
VLELRHVAHLTAVRTRTTAIDARRAWSRAFCALIVAGLLVPAGASADPSARVVGTDPPGDNITLARGESLYVRIEYSSERPVSIWARPYFGGKEVPSRSNASIPHDGTGEALGWFELIEPGPVDEVRILIGDGTRAGTKVVATHRMQLAATGEPARERVRAAWVDALSRQEAAVRRADYDKRMSEPVTTGDRLFFSGFMLAMLALLVGSLAWPAWGLWRWRGGWRAASVVPIAVMVFVVLRIVVDTARDPTSHNLWPFEILMWGGACVAFMVALKFARRVLRVG